MTKKVVNVPAIVLSILLVIAIAIIVFIVHNSQDSSTKIVTTNTDYKKTKEVARESLITNCGNTELLIDFSQRSIETENEDNYNCFANSIETCQKAKLIYEIEFKGVLGVNQKYSHYYELKGFQSGRCELYVKMNSYDSFSYSDRTV